MHAEPAVAVLLAEVLDVTASGLEDSKAQPQHRDECEVASIHARQDG
jgi:hypothetical protein